MTSRYANRRQHFDKMATDPSYDAFAALPDVGGLYLDSFLQVGSTGGSTESSACWRRGGVHSGAQPRVVTHACLAPPSAPCAQVVEDLSPPATLQLLRDTIVSYKNLTSAERPSTDSDKIQRWCGGAAQGATTERARAAGPRCWPV